MKKLISNAFVGLVLAISSFSAAATTYNYSYTFADATKVTGTFDGLASGNLITGLSNIYAFFNGTAFEGNGALFNASYLVNLDLSLGTANASFDGTDNNFIFSNRDMASLTSFEGLQIFSTTFVPLNKTNYAVLFSAENHAADSPDSQGTYDARRWTVTAVPEPETYAMLLSGLCLMGAIARRRKFKQA